jgi:hypothetical protein
MEAAARPAFEQLRASPRHQLGPDARPVAVMGDMEIVEERPPVRVFVEDDVCQTDDGAARLSACNAATAGASSARAGR